MAREIAFTSDDPGSSYPGYDPDEPTIETEKLAWFLRKQFYGMAGQGFEWQQEDWSGAKTVLMAKINAATTDIKDWIAACLAAVAIGNPIPALPNLFPNYDTDKFSMQSAILTYQMQWMLGCLGNIMQEFFSGKWANAGYAGRGSGDDALADLAEADVQAVQAWLNAAIQARLDGDPIPAKPSLSSPADYKGIASGNQITLNTQNNIRLRVNVSLVDGELKGALGMDKADLDELVEVIEKGLLRDENPLLEFLAATGLHIYIGQSAYVEYGDEPEP
jgi:hypothetical protein